MRKRTLAAVAVCFTLAACSGGNSGDSGSGDGASKEDAKTVAYVSPVGTQVGQQQLMDGLSAAAEGMGWQAKVLDAALSADKQVSHVNTLVTTGADAIASWTLDPNAVAGAYTAADKAGVPIIGVNSVGEGVHSTVWWEVNKCGAGSPEERSAQYIAEAYPGGKVVVLGGPPAPSIIANVQCFTDAAKAAGLEVVDQVDNTADAAGPASRLVADVLTKHPDVNAFWAYNDQTALGAGAAIQGAGMKVYDGSNDGIITIGMNGDPDAITAVQEGRLTGSWDCDSFGTGWAIALAMKDAFEGKPAQDYTVKSVFVTKETIGDWVDPADREYSFDNMPLVDTP